MVQVMELEACCNHLYKKKKKTKTSINLSLKYIECKRLRFNVLLSGLTFRKHLSHMKATKLEFKSKPVIIIVFVFCFCFCFFVLFFWQCLDVCHSSLISPLFVQKNTKIAIV